MILCQRDNRFGFKWAYENQYKFRLDMYAENGYCVILMDVIY